MQYKQIKLRKIVMLNAIVTKLHSTTQPKHVSKIKSNFYIFLIIWLHFEKKERLSTEWSCLIWSRLHLSTWRIVMLTIVSRAKVINRIKFCYRNIWKTHDVYGKTISRRDEFYHFLFCSRVSNKIEINCHFILISFS